MCGHALPVTVAVVAKFHPVSYGGSIRFSFVLATLSFGYRICFTKVICFSLRVSKENIFDKTDF